MEIKISQKGGKSISFSLLKEVIKIGNKADCDIVIEHPEIAPEHLQLTQSVDGRIKIKDLGSAQGTFVNDIQLGADEEIEFTTFFPAQLGKSFTVELLNISEREKKTCVMVRDASINFNNAAQNTPDQAAESSRPKVLTSSIKLSGSAGGPAIRPKQAIPTTKIKSSDPYKDELDALDEMDKKDGADKKTNPLIIIAPIFLAVAAYYYMNDGNILPQSGDAVPQTSVESSAPVNPSQVVTASPTFSQEKQDEFLTRFDNIAEQVVQKDKCLGQREKEFCEQFGVGRSTDYYEGGFYSEGIFFIALNVDMVMNQIKNDLPLQADSIEYFKDLYRKSLIEKLKQKIDAQKSDYENIEKQVAIYEQSNNFEFNQLSLGKKSEIVAAYYTFSRDLIKVLLEKPYITHISIVSFTRLQGKPVLTGYSVTSINKINSSNISQEDLRKTLSRTAYSGITTDFDNNIRPHFEKIVDKAIQQVQLQNNSSFQIRGGTNGAGSGTGN